MSLHYLPSKVNIVVDALSRFSIGILSHIDNDKFKLVRDIHHLSSLRVYLLDSEDGCVIVLQVVQASLSLKIKEI